MRIKSTGVQTDSTVMVAESTQYDEAQECDTASPRVTFTDQVEEQQIADDIANETARLLPFGIDAPAVPHDYETIAKFLLLQEISQSKDSRAIWKIWLEIRSHFGSSHFGSRQTTCSGSLVD